MPSRGAAGATGGRGGSKKTVVASQVRDVYAAMRNSDFAEPFVNPVTEDIAPGYFRLIKKPMDLATLGSKLDSYKSLEAFKKDAQLIWTNCRTYNDVSSEICTWATGLEQAFERALAKAAKASGKKRKRVTKGDVPHGGSGEAMDVASAPQPPSEGSTAKRARAQPLGGTKLKIRMQPMPQGGREGGQQRTGTGDAPSLTQREQRAPLPSDAYARQHGNESGHRLHIRGPPVSTQPAEERERLHAQARQLLAATNLPMFTPNMRVLSFGSCSSHRYYTAESIYPPGYKSVYLLSCTTPPRIPTGVHEQFLPKHLLAKLNGFPMKRILLEITSEIVADSTGPKFVATIGGGGGGGGGGTTLAQCSNPKQVLEKVRAALSRLVAVSATRLERCKCVLNRLVTYEGSGVFVDPVDETIVTDYRKYINDPMCLNQVHEHLRDGTYPTEYDFAEDVRLIFTNCMTYNAEGSDLHALARRMAAMFEVLFSHWVVNVPDASVVRVKDGPVEAPSGAWSEWRWLRRFDPQVTGCLVCGEGFGSTANSDGGAGAKHLERKFTCTVCGDEYHIQCLPADHNLTNSKRGTASWHCPRCVRPFNETGLRDATKSKGAISEAVYIGLDGQPMKTYWEPITAEGLEWGWSQQVSHGSGVTRNFLSPLGLRCRSMAEAQRVSIENVEFGARGSQLRKRIRAQRAKITEKPADLDGLVGSHSLLGIKIPEIKCRIEGLNDALKCPAYNFVGLSAGSDDHALIQVAEAANSRNLQNMVRFARTVENAMGYWERKHNQAVLAFPYRDADAPAPPKAAEKIAVFPEPTARLEFRTRGASVGEWYLKVLDFLSRYERQMGILRVSGLQLWEALGIEMEPEEEGTEDHESTPAKDASSAATASESVKIEPNKSAMDGQNPAKAPSEEVNEAEKGASPAGQDSNFQNGTGVSATKGESQSSQVVVKKEPSNGEAPKPEESAAGKTDPAKVAEPTSSADTKVAPATDANEATGRAMERNYRRRLLPQPPALLYNEIGCALVKILLLELKHVVHLTSKRQWHDLLALKPLNILTWGSLAYQLVACYTSYWADASVTSTDVLKYLRSGFGTPSQSGPRQASAAAQQIASEIQPATLVGVMTVLISHPLAGIFQGPLDVQALGGNKDVVPPKTPDLGSVRRKLGAYSSLKSFADDLRGIFRFAKSAFLPYSEAWNRAQTMACFAETVLQEWFPSLYSPPTQSESAPANAEVEGGSVRKRPRTQDPAVWSPIFFGAWADPQLEVNPHPTPSPSTPLRNFECYERSEQVQRVPRKRWRCSLQNSATFGYHYPSGTESCPAGPDWELSALLRLLQTKQMEVWTSDERCFVLSALCDVCSRTEFVRRATEMDVEQLNDIGPPKKASSIDALGGHRSLTKELNALERRDWGTDKMTDAAKVRRVMHLVSQFDEESEKAPTSSESTEQAQPPKEDAPTKQESADLRKRYPLPPLQAVSCPVGTKLVCAVSHIRHSVQGENEGEIVSDVRSKHGRWVEVPTVLLLSPETAFSGGSDFERPQPRDVNWGADFDAPGDISWGGKLVALEHCVKALWTARLMGWSTEQRRQTILTKAIANVIKHKESANLSAEERSVLKQSMAAVEKTIARHSGILGILDGNLYMTVGGRRDLVVVKERSSAKKRSSILVYEGSGQTGLRSLMKWLLERPNGGLFDKIFCLGHKSISGAGVAKLLNGMDPNLDAKEKKDVNLAKPMPHDLGGAINSAASAAERVEWAAIAKRQANWLRLQASRYLSLKATERDDVQWQDLVYARCAEARISEYTVVSEEEREALEILRVRGIADEVEQRSEVRRLREEVEDELEDFSLSDGYLRSNRYAVMRELLATTVASRLTFGADTTRYLHHAKISDDLVQRCKNRGRKKYKRHSALSDAANALDKPSFLPLAQVDIATSTLLKVHEDVASASSAAEIPEESLKDVTSGPPKVVHVGGFAWRLATGDEARAYGLDALWKMDPKWREEEKIPRKYIYSNRRILDVRMSKLKNELISMATLLLFIGRTDYEPGNPLGSQLFLLPHTWLEQLKSAETIPELKRLLVALEHAVPPPWIGSWYKPQAFDPKPLLIDDLALHLYTLDRAILWQPLLSMNELPAPPKPLKSGALHCVLSPMCLKGFNHKGKCDARNLSFSRISFFDGRPKTSPAAPKPVKRPAMTSTTPSAPSEPVTSASSSGSPVPNVMPATSFYPALTEIMHMQQTAQGATASYGGGMQLPAHFGNQQQQQQQQQMQMKIQQMATAQAQARAHQAQMQQAQQAQAEAMVQARVSMQAQMQAAHAQAQAQAHAHAQANVQVQGHPHAASMQWQGNPSAHGAPVHGGYYSTPQNHGAFQQRQNNPEANASYTHSINSSNVGGLPPNGLPPSR